MNTVTVRGLSREHCVMTMVFSILDELVGAGVVEGDLRLSTEGKKVVDELRAAGFAFNDGELEQHVEFLFSPDSSLDNEELH